MSRISTAVVVLLAALVVATLAGGRGAGRRAAGLPELRTRRIAAASTTCSTG